MDRKQQALLLSLLLTLFVVWFGQPVVQSASESIELLSVFNADERDQAGWVKTAFEAGNYDFPLNKYGHFYFDIVLTELYVADWFVEVADHHIIFALRWTSAAFSILTLVMLFWMVASFTDNLTGWLSVGLLFAIPLNFWELTYQAHPDTAQLFFILCSLYWIVHVARSDHYRPILLASLFAGLTFSVKYSGLFLLPVLFLTDIVRQCQRNKAIPSSFDQARFLRLARYGMLSVGLIGLLLYWLVTPENVGRYIVGGDGVIGSRRNISFIKQIQLAGLLLGIIGLVSASVPLLWTYLRRNVPLSFAIQKLSGRWTISLLVFGGIFVITSPYLLEDFQFLRGLLQQSEIISGGHVYKETAGFFGWFKVLYSPRVLDGASLLLAFVGVITGLARVVSRGLKSRSAIFYVSLIWIVVYFTMLVLRIAHHPPRFLLPMLPLVIMFSAFGITTLLRGMARRLKASSGLPLLPISSALVMLIFFVLNGSQLLHYRTEIANRVSKSSYVEAGVFLKEKYDDTTRILHDAYSYIPPKFWNHIEAWGMTQDMVEEFNPEVIVVNDKMSLRYKSRGLATQYAGGEELYLKSYQFYRNLKQDSLEYKLIKDFGPVQIFEDQRSQPVDSLRLDKLQE